MAQASMQETATGARYATPPPNRTVVFDQGSDTLETNLRMPLLLFSDDDADTFVYIEPAPRSQPKRWGAAQQTATQPIPHRIHSQKLLNTGSDVLKDLFQPRKQARVRKRYGLTHNMPLGVKYAIDLTPPSEGDEAVIFMTELSCPMGVRTWAALRHWWKLPPICVAGQDEVEWLPAPEPDAKKPKIVNDSDLNTSTVNAGEDKVQRHVFVQSDSPKKQLSMRTVPFRRTLNWQGNLPTLRADLDTTSSDQISSNLSNQEIGTENSAAEKEAELPSAVKKVPGLPLDYSPIRHRTCLERVLHALEGLDPKLDTAPKFWTFFALAKLLQVATHPAVGDRILVWLYQDSNSLFVEFNPELSYQISCGLQNRNLCHDSFAILVSEEALLVLTSLIKNQGPVGPVSKRWTRTLHGRSREPLDDTEVQRVEYASKVFLDRILSEFIDLAGTEMRWVENIVMENINGPLQMPEHKSFVDDLVAFCKLYARSQIYQFLIMHSVPNNEFRFTAIDHVDYPGLEYYDAQATMPTLCRILTRTFWKSLGDITLLGDVFFWKHSSLKELAPELPILQDQGGAIVRQVQSREVDQVISSFLQGVNGTSCTNARSSIFFDFTYFKTDFALYLNNLSTRMRSTPNSERDAFSPFGVQFEIADTLVCLGEEELKFLPLWAGGNDDGTGGVFADQAVPLVNDGGFSTAGPSVHQAGSIDDDGFSMSSFDTINPDDAASTIERASHEATNSHATTIMSEGTSISDFELIGPVRDMDIRSNQSTIQDDFDIDMTVGDEHSAEDFEFSYDNDDDDDDSTIGTISDREDK